MYTREYYHFHFIILLHILNLNPINYSSWLSEDIEIQYDLFRQNKLPGSKSLHFALFPLISELQ